MIRNFFFILSLCFLVTSAAILVGSKGALAQGDHPCVCCCTPTCAPHINTCSSNCGCTSTNQTNADIDHITNEFIYHREWLTRIVWEPHHLPAMLLMTEQMTAMALHQTASIGMLFDAKHQLESERLLQEVQAQAHKDYQVSEGVCTFGTNTRTLAASDQNAKTSDLALSTFALARQTMSGDNISSGGTMSDRESRWAQFRGIYCDPGSNSSGFDALCYSSDSTRYNKDIDFSRTVDSLYTLQVDFTPAGDGDHTVGEASDDEADILALQSNLYAHRLIPDFSDLYFMSTEDGDIIEKGAYLYLDARSLTAQRQVAMASYNALTSMKSQGENNVEPYMRALFEEVGIEPAQAQELLGDRPSYYAQMELLTKKLYQNPKFFTDLYDKPANIDRKDVAMQAISLMQKRDMYDSLLRMEMSQSIWLETELEQLQERYQNLRSTATAETPVIREVLRPLGY